MKLLTDLEVSSKRVFVRADLDVPLEKSQESGVKNQELEGSTRLLNLKNTVNYLLGKEAKVIIAGHIDRPEKPDPSLSTKQLIEPLQDILGQQISFADQIPNTGYKIPDTNIVLLENLRFWPGEIANDQEFAKQLAAIADCYVNEAFGNCHRLHASMVSLPALLPHAAGFHLQQEVEELSKLLSGPTKPFVAIVGGAKIETKLPLVRNLSQIADNVLVGGELPLEIKKQGLSLPPDVIVANLTADSKDIDAASQNKFSQIIHDAKSVIWNGPMGLYEEGNSAGTLAIAKAIVQSGAYSLVGGGETVDFLAKNNLVSQFSFVSAGGGAMLEFLSGKTLPAIEALG